MGKHGGHLGHYIDAVADFELPNGARTLTKVSVQFSFRAFLAEISSGCVGSFSQSVCLLEPVTVRTTLHHWLEMTVADTYRQVVQVRMGARMAVDQLEFN